MSEKGEGKTQTYAQITGDRVTVRVDSEMSTITFDRKPTQVSMTGYKSSKSSVEEGNPLPRKDEA